MRKDRLRIAFLTPEFVTEWSTGGGLGNYLNRMTQALRDQGHQPEIFVSSKAELALIEHEGIPVHRVRPDSDIRRPVFRLGWRMTRLLCNARWIDFTRMSSAKRRRWRVLCAVATVFRRSI